MSATIRSQAARCRRLARDSIQRAAQLAFVAVLVACPFSSCESTQGSGLRPSSRQYSSAWMEMLVGGMTADADQGRVLLVTLRNKSSERTWVKVSFAPPAPNAPCEVVKEIQPGTTESFECVQQSIVADADYPVRISVYRDAALANSVEEKETHFRFSRKEAEAFEELARMLQAAKQ